LQKDIAPCPTNSQTVNKTRIIALYEAFIKPAAANKFVLSRPAIRDNKSITQPMNFLLSAATHDSEKPGSD